MSTMAISQMAKGKCESAVAAPRRQLAFIAPRHPDGGNWPWLSTIGPMRRHSFRPIYIENTYRRFRKATRMYIRWQYFNAMRAIGKVDLAFLFSTEIGIGMTNWPMRLLRQPKRVYVGFTQDGDWSSGKIERLGIALRSMDAVTVFSNEERQLYVDRYALQPQRVHLIPIHTDETQGYERYDAAPPVAQPYVLSMGSPNRRFMPIARVCRDLGIPLVIVTRPTHKADSLHELAALGATIVTNADRHRALSYLRHARLASMVFADPALPGAFTTIIHAMFLGTPCVVSSCLGMNDYIADGETGLITPHADESALRDAVQRLWNDPATMQQFVTNGLKRAQAEFSLEAAASHFDALVDRVIDGPS